MSDKDSVTKEYMQDSATFADAFNFLLFGGRQVIHPEQLRPLDTTAIVLPFGEEDAGAPVQKYRDVLKLVTAMEDGRAAYLLLGIENQSQLHYAMPVRNMLYDAMQYAAQVDEAAKSHRKNEAKAESGAEYLSGFYRTDRLLPVITLTLYFGAEEWSAPRDLHEMLAVDEEFLPFVENYRLHLLAPADIADEDFSRFHTELRLALKYMKYAKDKKRLREVVHEDGDYQKVSRRTADMVNVVTGSKLRYQPDEEGVNMCQAIEEMRKDALDEGIEIGVTKGRTEGIEIGVTKGRAEGRAEGVEEGIAKGILGAIAICRDLGLSAGETLDRIASRFSLTRDEAEAYLRKALSEA